MIPALQKLIGEIKASIYTTWLVWGGERREGLCSPQSHHLHVCFLYVIKKINTHMYFNGTKFTRRTHEKVHRKKKWLPKQLKIGSPGLTPHKSYMWWPLPGCGLQDQESPSASHSPDWVHQSSPEHAVHPASLHKPCRWTSDMKRKEIEGYEAKSHTICAKESTVGNMT